MKTKPKLLITGGAGFIGTNFIHYLLEQHPDYSIIVLDALTYAGSLENFSSAVLKNPDFQFCHGDIRNVGLVMDLVSQVDIVIHFAAETHVARSIHDDRRFFETDVLGTQAVANAVLKNKKQIERYIHISTSEVYGTALTIPMTEEHPLNPANPYAAAKLGADRLVYSYWCTYHLPVVILRPFNQYGPFQHLEKVIPRFITSALMNEPLSIHGQGHALRDWLYVRDTCERIDQILHADPDKVLGEVFNLGSGFETDIVSIAAMIIAITGRPDSLLTYMPDRPGQVSRHLSSTAKARQVLGITNGRSFKKGLEQTVDWYRNNKTWWQRLLPMRQVSLLDQNGKTCHY